MPSKQKPDRSGLKGLDQYATLKQITLDAAELKSQWYARQGLSPRVGRPVEQVGRRQVEAAVNALMPVLERLHRLRARRPDTQFPLISQGRLRKLVIKRLKQENVDVPANNKTVRDACKALRLTRGSKKMSDYTLDEWRWLVKHSTPTDRQKTRKLVASFTETSALKLKASALKLEKVKVLKLSPVAKKMLLSLHKWQISHHTKRLARYERALTFFTPRP